MTFEKGNTISILGGQGNRSRELRKAWTKQDEIRQLKQEGWSYPKLAKKYKISERSCFRIVKGK